MPTLIHWSLFFILFSLPWLFFPYFYLAFELPKVLVLYILSTLILIGLILHKFRLGRLNLSHKLAYVFFIWLVISSILGINFEHSFWGNYFRREGILTYICFLILFIASGTAFKNKLLRTHAAWAVVISSSVVAILGVIEFVTFWFFGHTEQLLYSGRIISTFGQPNFLGSFLVLSLPIFWYLIKVSQKPQQVLLWLLSSLTVLATFFTFSRSAWLALAILLMVWGFYHLKAFLTVLIGLIVVATILANLFPLLVFKEWSRFKVDLNQKWTAENRLVIAQKSVELIGKKPITGWGMENFVLAFPLVLQTGDLGLRQIVVDSAHNLFLDIAVESGLIGLGVFIIFLITLFWSGLISSKQHDHEEKQFILASLSVILAFIICHQFSPLSVVPQVLFWITAGYLSGPALIHTTIHSSTLNLSRVLVVCISLLTAYFVIQNIRADIIFRQASAYEVSDIDKAIRLDNQAIDIAPWVLFFRWRRDFLIRQLG